jgi:hypothetical protein
MPLFSMDNPGIFFDFRKREREMFSTGTGELAQKESYRRGPVIRTPSLLPEL